MPGIKNAPKAPRIFAVEIELDRSLHPFWLLEPSGEERPFFIRKALKLAFLQETILITYDLILEYNNSLYDTCKEGFLILKLNLKSDI